MKNYTSSKTLALIGLIASAAVASANLPPVNVSAGTVGGVAGNLGGTFGAPGVTGAAGSTVGGGFNGAMATIDADPSAGFQAGPVPGQRIAAFESMGMRQARLATDAEPLAETATSTETTVSPVANEQAASALLSTGFSSDTIRAANAAERQQLAADINQRIEATSDAMATLKDDAKTLDDDIRADFKAAAKEVKASEKKLKKSVKAVRKASAETWAEKRAEVAADYESYLQSIARAEAIVVAEKGVSAASTTRASGAIAGWDRRGPDRTNESK